jgi:cytosine/creatinine deaminase
VTLLGGGRLADGSRADVRVDPASGTVTEVAPGLTARQGEEIVDCDGLVVLDAPVEPHAHLDKAGTWDAAPNPDADLMSAVRTWATGLAHRSAEEVLHTAWPVLEDLVLHGATAVRTHVNLNQTTGWAPLEALVALRDDAAREGLAVVQVVALVSTPLSGDAGAEHRRILEEALGRGADLAGGAPHIDPDPAAALDAVLAIAERHGVGVDLHTDETLDPDATGLGHLAARVSELGWGRGRATASHCVSLGEQQPEQQAVVAAAVAAAGVSVIALPQTNLYLQGRDRASAVPRGLTATRALLTAGANVAAGGDNVRDAFNAVGRADPLETAALMVMAGHLTPAEAWHAVGAAGRVAMGLPAAGPVPGAVADLLCVEGRDLVDAVARAGQTRTVVRAGRVVARTVVRRSLLPAPGAAPLEETP